MTIEIVDIFPLKMVIFHSYVSLPEGTPSTTWIADARPPEDVSACLVHPHEGITGADEAQYHPRRGCVRLVLAPGLDFGWKNLEMGMGQNPGT